MAGVLARVLWDTGCSDQLIHPDFGWELIRRGAAWRYCDPLYMNHGDASKTKGGAPAIIQVCAKDIVLVHNGDTYRMEDVWFYMYEGALPDVMLSDTLLNSIACITTPGKRLIDTWEYVGDRDILRQYMADAHDILVHQVQALSLTDAAASHLCNTSASQPSAPPDTSPSAATDGASTTPPLQSERIQKLLEDMEEQRKRLVSRIGKPLSDEAYQSCLSVLDRYPENFRPPGGDPCKLPIFRITLKDKSKFHICLPRRVNPIMLQEIRKQVAEQWNAVQLTPTVCTPLSWPRRRPPRANTVCA